MFLGCFAIPFVILAVRKFRTITGTVIASVCVCVGMWLERFLIVAPTLSRPRLPYEHGIYHPTWVEISIFAGEIAALCLLYCLFAKLFPIVSIWELREKHEEAEIGAEASAGAVAH
jgi:molybdopterin-containing oxidoreductase family membrane subunit